MVHGKRTNPAWEASETTLMHCVAAAKLRYPACAKAMDEAFGGGGGDDAS